MLLIHLTIITMLILLVEKFMKSDWLRREVFQPSLKTLRVEITVAMAMGETTLSCC